MAIVLNPITGRSKQKMGNVVFTTIFGKNVLKSKPLTVKNPKSPKQCAQRNRFNIMISVLRLVLPYVKAGFKSAATGMSAFNLANKVNIFSMIEDLTPGGHTVIMDDDPGFQVNWPDFLGASGTLMGADTPSVAATADKKITISWVNNSGQGDALATDLAYLLVVNWLKKRIMLQLSGTTRLVGTKEFVVPTLWVGDTVYTFIAFHAEIGSKTSDSSYAGTAVVLA